MEYRGEYDAAWKTHEWLPVRAEHDYTRQDLLRGLKPNQRYEVRVSSRSKAGAVGETVLGSFRTAPEKEEVEKVLFTVTTGTRYPHQDAPGGGFKMYDSMLKLDPELLRPYGRYSLLRLSGEDQTVGVMALAADVQPADQSSNSIARWPATSSRTTTTPGRTTAGRR